MSYVKIMHNVYTYIYIEPTATLEWALVARKGDYFLGSTP